MTETNEQHARHAAVRSNFETFLNGPQHHTLKEAQEKHETVFEHLSKEKRWRRLLLQPIPGSHHKIAEFRIPLHFLAWKAARLLVSPKESRVKWRAEWFSGQQHIMHVDSDLVSLYADLSSDFKRSDIEDECILLFEPSLSAQPNLICSQDIIRIERDLDTGKATFRLIVDVCEDISLGETIQWREAVVNAQTTMVRHVAQKIVLLNNCNGTTVPRQLFFSNIGNALLIRVDELDRVDCPESILPPFNSCKLYLDDGVKEKRLFLTVTQADLYQIRPGWFVIPMSPDLSSFHVLSATSLSAFRDRGAALDASRANISIEFSGQAPDMFWQATIYWQHVNWMCYSNGLKAVLYV